MGWVENKLDYAGGRLEHAVEVAASELNQVVRDGIREAGGELRDVVLETSREVDHKLATISDELARQRNFTKSDVKELVDYAAERMGETLDARMGNFRNEINELLESKVEYFKREVDTFFIRRQRDLARERRRLVANVLLAGCSSLAVGGVSLLYHRVNAGTGLDVFTVFRIVFASLAGGYAVYLLVNVLLKLTRMAEHKKDTLFVVMRYWGVLKPQSIFMQVAVLVVMAVVYVLLFFPDFLWPGGLSPAPALWLQWLQWLKTSA